MRLPVRVIPMIAAIVTLLVIAGVWLVIQRHPITGFSYAKAQGWSIAPVRIVRLQPRWIQHLEPMPPRLSRQEVAVALACQHCLPLNNSSNPTAALRAYQQIGTQYPASFYPKHCIAAWYEEHGNIALYWKWEHQALKQAPQVLAGKVVDSSGKPIANLSLEIDAYTLEDTGKQARALVAYNFEATTDDAGCWYLPVYHGLYVTAFQLSRLLCGVQGDSVFSNHRFQSGSSGQMYDCVQSEAVSPNVVSFVPWQSNFPVVATSRVGVFPTIVARPEVRVTSPVGPQVAYFLEKSKISDFAATKLEGNILDFRWQPVPGAKQYCVTIIADGEQPKNGIENLTGDFSQFRLTSPQLRLTVNPPHTLPAQTMMNFCCRTAYHMTILVYDNDRSTPDDDALIDSGQYDFIPASAPQQSLPG